MIIDCFTSVGATVRNHATKLLRPFDDTSAVDGLIGVLDRVGVDRAITFAPRWLGGSVLDATYAEGNKEVYEATQRFPARLVGYGRVDPSYGAAAVDELSRCLSEYGFKGFLLDAEWENVEAGDNELVYPLVQLAADHDVPVLVESGYSPVSPATFWRLADDFSDTPFILAHMGGRLTTDAIMIAKRAPNIYLETSDHMYYLGQYAEEIGADRVLFGSNTPFAVPEAELFKVTVREDLTAEEKGLILGGNAARLHGIA